MIETEYDIQYTLRLVLLNRTLLPAIPVVVLVGACSPSVEEQGNLGPSRSENFSTDILEAPAAADIRSMEDELDFMRGKARTLRMNTQGHWEADFDHGIKMIYVPAVVPS